MTDARETVWVIKHGNKPPGMLVMIYDNEAAARAHVEFWDGMVLGGYSEMLAVEPWAVQSEFHGEIPEQG